MTTIKTQWLHRVVHGTGRRGGHDLIPEIFEIGWGRFAVADPRHLAPHRHPGAFEVCLILSGEVEWETADDSYVLRAGDLFLTQPGELHWGRDSAMQPCTLNWLHLDADPDAQLWAAFPRQLGIELRERLLSAPRQIRGATGPFAATFQTMLEEHAAQSDNALDNELRQANARAALQQLVVGLVRQIEAAERRTHARVSVPRSVERAIALIRSAPQQSLTAKQIADGVGETVARLNDLFSAHIGMSLTQFSLRERVRIARSKLLDSQQPVTEIAHDLGFSSSQHFATMFKRLTGISPTTYRSSQRDRTAAIK